MTSSNTLVTNKRTGGTATSFISSNWAITIGIIVIVYSLYHRDQNRDMRTDRKWMRRKGWHGVYYFNLVFVHPIIWRAPISVKSFNFCKSTIFTFFAFKTDTDWFNALPFPNDQIKPYPYSLSNHFLIMIDQNFLSRWVLKPFQFRNF